MLIFRLMNGLGNQMFILAFAESMKKKYPQHDIVFDDSYIPSVLNGREMRELSTVFEHDFNSANDRQIRKIYKRPFYNSKRINSELLDRIRKKLNSFSYGQDNIIYFEEPEYWDVDDEFIDKMCNLHLSEDNRQVYYFIGFWENVRYLSGIENELSHIFEFKIRNEKIISKSKVIGSAESVAVHVRRGDYLRESLSQAYPRNNYLVCEKDYYEQAISIINEHVEKPTFFFFSDDPDYINDEFSHIPNKEVISGNADYEDLFLMSKCKHVIMANSTFSFWAALLRQSEEGMAIAPKIHYVHMENSDHSKLMPFFQCDKWQYIDNSI